jgi:hypothetical protein
MLLDNYSHNNIRRIYDPTSIIFTQRRDFFSIVFFSLPHAMWRGVQGRARPLETH